MSRLDRIYTRMPNYEQHQLVTTWTFTTSDHAALILTMNHTSKMFKRNEHVKLDNEVEQNNVSLQELTNYVREQMLDTDGMNPHTKLEFLKMTVRTKALEIMASNRRKENGRLTEIDGAIKENMRLLTVYTDPHSNVTLTRELEDLNIEKNAILNSQGVKLALRAKTKWYNEGERSNKYFLNLSFTNGVSEANVVK